jgi:dephospho-CoA kinase
LYEPDGAGTAAIAALFPQAVGPSGVDRDALRKIVAQNASALREIENVIHPLVAADREDFLKANSDKPLVLLDIPLLFETGADAWLDKTVVVSTDPETQRSRVLERPGMDAAHFELILSKQVPDHEKRARADYVVETHDMDTAARDVDRVLTALTGA